MGILYDKKVGVEVDDFSAVRGYQDYQQPVYAVCHHSNQYVTRFTANPSPTRPFQKQSEFPGLPELDGRFAHAAHAAGYQHWGWRYGRIVAAILAVMGVAALALAVYLFTQGSQIPPGSDRLVYVLALLLAVLVGVAALVGAYALGVSNGALRERLVGPAWPAVEAYPLICRYQLAAQESFTVLLGNTSNRPPEVDHQKSELAVSVYPLGDEPDAYQAYRARYPHVRYGRAFYAGVVALEKLRHVQFARDALAQEHRVILRASSEQLPATDDRFTWRIPYQVTAAALYPDEDKLDRFPLECMPMVSSRDSRQLELHFHWWGNKEWVCILEDCRLVLPDVLLPVVNVDVGGFHQTQVVWSGHPFQAGRCVLRVTCHQPILSCQEKIEGTYRLGIKDRLLSGMEVNAHHVWTAWGQRAPKDQVTVRLRTVIEGKLLIDPQRLSQAHEQVSTARSEFNVPPDEQTLTAVLDVLTGAGIDVHQLVRAAPRLDPAGNGRTRLHYWDITGRFYAPDTLAALDLHVVVSGHGHTPAANGGHQLATQTEVDIWAGCRRDPRLLASSTAPDAWLCSPTYVQNLMSQIRQAIEKTDA